MVRPVLHKVAIGDLATLLARAYLRFAEKQRHVAIFDPKKVQKPLEVCAPESPDEVGESATEAKR